MVCKLSVHGVETLGVNSRSGVMVLRMEFAMFREEAPRKGKETFCCGAPIFFIPKYVLDNLLDEGFKIKKISTILAVSESTIHHRMSQYGLSKLQFIDIQTRSSMRKLKKLP